MKIFGIGTDIVNIKRMEKSLKKYGFKFKRKIFSHNEIIYCENKIVFVRVWWSSRISLLISSVVFITPYWLK